MTLAVLPSALDLRACAQTPGPLGGEVPLATLTRLLEGLPSWPEALSLRWRAQVEWRQAVPRDAARVAPTEPELWLHLEVQATVPQVCQRCLSPYLEPVVVARWFRFVATEALALAEDENSDEDLLVFEPRFDLAALLEDELLLALPLVPMHATCPQPVTLHTDNWDETDTVASSEAPHPFAALAALKRPPNSHH